jgi:glycosyltransferase involved in cell wall biosynthesis
MNDRKPLFTIATVTFNSVKTVRDAIESVLASSFSDFELLISDDHSTDDTWSVIQQYDDPRIRAWRNEQNLGEYPNRNKILDAANGAYILYVDGDDILYKHTLRTLSEYAAAFPKAGMIWGVQPANIDFAVLPYLFEPDTTMRLIYETTIPLAAIGFTETVFRTEALKKAGGLAVQYSIGDTYIKKRMALDYSVLFVPMGFMFWRRTDNQASARANESHKNFLEAWLIDREIVSRYASPGKAAILRQLKGSFVRRLLINTLLKGNIKRFADLWNRAGLRWSDLQFLFVRYNVTYRPTSSNSEPLFNDFNFRP